MVYSVESIEDEISGVANAHITPHGAQYTTVMTEEGVLITVHHGKWSASQFTRLRGLPANHQGELIHCATHALAMTLITHLHPT
jgi:hypothetical protein